MNGGWRRLLALFSGTVASQGLLSAASLATGLLLIRHASAEQYASYVLVLSAILLAVSLQGAYLGPPLMQRLAPLAPVARAQLLATLWREQRRVILLPAGLVATVVLVLALARSVSPAVAMIAATGTVAATLALRRDFFRMAMLSERRAASVLRADVAYALLLVTGAALASRMQSAAAIACLGAALAALVAGSLMLADLRTGPGWPPAQQRQALLRSFAAVGAWSAAGAAIHWCFGQSYNLLAAAVLDLQAVATIAATRLTMMPVNLLSAGVGSLLLPLSAGWLLESGARTLLHRLIAIGVGLLLCALAYSLLLWLARDWVFTTLLHQRFAQRDSLLLAWMACFAVAALRDALLYLPVASGRQRPLTALAAASAVASIVGSLWGMHRWGPLGAPCGVLVGECLNLAGVIVLCAGALPQRSPSPLAPHGVLP